MNCKTNHFSQRFLSALMALMLLASAMPMGAFASDVSTDPATSIVAESDTDPADNIEQDTADNSIVVDDSADVSEPVSDDNAEETAHAEISASDDADIGEAESVLETQPDEVQEGQAEEAEVEAETENSVGDSNLSLMAVADGEFGSYDGTTSIPYAYGSGITISTTGNASAYGSGMSSKKTATTTNSSWSGVAYRTFTNTTKSSTVYADYYQNGHYTDSNGKYQTCDTRIYFWIDSASSTGAITEKKGYWGAAYVMTDVANKNRTKPCIIHMEFHFYKGGTLKSGTSNELSTQKGFMYLMDLDFGEGYYLNSGVSKAYLSPDTNIIRETDTDMPIVDEEVDYSKCYLKGTYAAWTGCSSLSLADKGANNALGIGFSATPSSPLSITYYACSRYFSTIHDTSVKLTYKIVEPLPTGHTPEELTPAVRHFATFTKTSGTASLFNSSSYTAVDGYVFTGWYTNSSLTGSKYTGTDNMSKNITIYGKYETANLNIDKYLFLGDTADEEAVSLLASNKNANFTFTIAGATSATQTYLKNHPEKAKVTISGSQFTRSVDANGKVNIMARATVKELLPGAYTVTETTVNSGEAIWYISTDSANGYNNPQTLTLTTGTNSTKFRNIIRRRTITVNKAFAESYDLSSMTTTDKTFTFTLTGTTVLGTKVSEKQTLVGTGSVKFTNIHAGDYTLTETASDQWMPVASKTVKIRDNYVQIDGTETASTTFTNTVVPPPDPESGNLSVTKYLNLNGCSTSGLTTSEQTFTFTVSGTANDGTAVNQTKSVVGAGTVTFYSLPLGMYTVRESYDSTVWTANVTSRSATVTANSTASVSFTNTLIPPPEPDPEYGNLTVTKNVNLNGGSLDTMSDAEKTFTFTLSGTGDDGTAVNETKSLIGAGSVTFSHIPVGTYTLREAYDAYWWSCGERTQTVTVRKDVTTSVTVTNNRQTRQIDILVWEVNHAGTTTKLPNVQFHVEDSTGKVVTLNGQTLRFVSDGTDTPILDVPAGNYTIVVDSVPAGYVMPESVPIVVKDTTETQYYNVYVPTIIIDIKAIDATTELPMNGNVLATVYDANGKPVYENVTLEYIKEYVPAGNYSVKVTKVPDRYAYPNDTPITVQAIKEMQTFIIPIEHLGSITIKKYDTDGKTPLKGVEFALFDSNGAVLMRKTTDASGTVVFIAPDGLVAGRYTVAETKTVKGHTLMAEPIRCEIPYVLTDAQTTAQHADTAKGWHNANQGKWYWFDLTYQVTNSSTFDLPMTGGFMTPQMWAVWGIAMLLMAGASAWLVTSKPKHQH